MDLNANVPLVLSLVFVVGGLVALALSADWFVASAARIARAFGVAPLIVGMVIIGFGTSAPELAVSVLSGMSGHSNLSLGNAYGSCVFNLAVILGVVALIRPIVVKPSVCFLGVPMLLVISGVSYWLVRDGSFSRSNGMVLLALFAVAMPFYCWYDQCGKPPEAPAGNAAVATRPTAGVATWIGLVAGLALLVASSHVLVWGCVDFARDVLHVSDLMIGLTIVAAGTSFPELASAIASARRGEHEFVIGNIVGSNVFNTLAVVGLAGTISPFRDFSPCIVSRDIPAMLALSASLAVFGLNYRNPRKTGVVTRWEGALWLCAFAAYLTLMIMQETK